MGVQMFEVLPFNIRVDYLPRRVDLAALRAGNYVELVNMVQWKVRPLTMLARICLVLLVESI